MSSLCNSRKGKKCVLYLRVSLERQVDGYSIEGQREYLQDWAAREGMEVVEVYTDAGKSGKSISGRDEFQRMLNDISSHRIDIDYVVVFKLSRFGRNAKDVLNTLSLLQQHGVNLLCREDGLDSSTQMGKLLITVLGAVAEMERENILAQSMLGREEKARQGGWNGGSAPYGYTRANGKHEILQINEEEARIVRLIFEKFVSENMGYSNIAEYLNQQGITKTSTPITSKRYTDWSSKQIKRILTNPAYIGKITFGKIHQERIEGSDGEYKRRKTDDYIISDAGHEPIVSEEVFKQAQLKCETTKASKATGVPAAGRPRKNLLTGLLKCPQCGGAMYAAKKGSGDSPRVYYVCGHYSIAKGGQCGKNSIRADWVEAEVVEYTKKLVRNPQFSADIQEKIGQKVDSSEIVQEIAGYQATVKKLERSKANLERDIDRIVDDDRNAQRKREDLNRRLDKIYDEIYDVEDKIADCEARRLAVEQQNISTDNIFKALQMFDQCFDQMERDDKCQILGMLISEIQLLPKSLWEDGRNPIKTIAYTFPVAANDGGFLWGNIGHAL